MDLPFELAPGVVFALDVSPASWIDERLLPMDRTAGVRVGEVIPTGFEAYARVFHPARDRHDGSPIGWSEIAQRRGTVVHPEMQFEHLSGVLQPEVVGLVEPDEGCLPQPECEALSDVLAEFAGD